MVEATCAPEDLDDFTARPGQAWVWVLKHAEKAQAWTFLEEKARMALQNSVLRRNATLGLLAQDFLRQARAKLDLS